MQRTNVIQLRPSKSQKKILRECMLLSSCVYNQANYIIRQQFFNNDKISSWYDLQQQVQNTDDYQTLGRSYALPRIQVYGETNSARFKLIKSRTQEWVGLPKYYKNRKTNTTIPSYLVIDGCQYSIKKNYVLIPLSRQMRKKYKIGRYFKIRYNGVLRWKGNQQRGQIRYKDNKFYLYQPVELKDKKKAKSKIKAGLDLGIKRLLGIYINNEEDKIIGNKRFFRQWEYWTGLIAQEQSRLHLQNKRTSKNLQKLYRLRSKWQNNLYNNVVAKMFRVLKRNNVSTLVVGDLTGIRKNNNKGKTLNQMVHNYWSFDLMLKKIENKAEEFGIEIEKETEEFTSQACPICGELNKPKDRIYICSFCGNIEHRDIVGGKNILFKSMYGSIESIHWGETAPLEGVV